MQDNNKIYHAIIKTLSYSDVFDYPLRKRELWKFLNVGSFVDKGSFLKVIGPMIDTKQIEEKNGFYFLNGRGRIVSTRLKRRKISFIKLKIANKAARIISFIPTIKLVGVSGSLSLKNAQKEDDIDFFIITKEKSLWLTRFLVNVLLIAAGYKRSTHDTRGMNLICPNLFLSEDSLILPLLRRNLFSSREIVQLHTLIDRDNTYKKFLAANSWIKSFLGNTKIPRKKYNYKNNSSSVLGFFDKIFYAFQFLYMSNRITGEDIKQKSAYFHPQDKGKVILKLYKMRYEEYSKNILQDIDNKQPFLYI